MFACDLPFVDAAFLDWLFEQMNDADAVVPYVDGKPQPTHAVFSTDPTRRAAENATSNASGGLRDVLDRLDVVDVPESRVLEETTKTSFADVNTPADLETLADIDSSDSRDVD